MSWRDAPLYVEAHDLARWLLERVESWPERCHLAAPAVAAGVDLVTGVALALTFPERRGAHLLRVDEAIVRLRMLLRLARDLGHVSPGGLRFAGGRLRTIGRMVGGWTRRIEQAARGIEPEFEGKGLPCEARDAGR